MGMPASMRLEAKVIEIRTSKKASFDGKSYLIRVPSQVVRFFKERGISVEDIILEGIWELKEKVFGVLLIFGDIKEGSTVQGKEPKVDDKSLYDENKEPDDQDDYVVLSG